MPISPSAQWEEGLPAAARTLRNLIYDVDSASAPLWSGPQLDAAVFRYTEIFLPILAVHLSGCGNNRSTARPENQLAALKKATNEKLARDYRVMKVGTISRRELSNSEERKAFLSPSRALKKNCESFVLIPPLDVVFCWALRRLPPKEYERDCMRMFGRNLDTKNRLEYGSNAKSAVARLQWSCFSFCAIYGRVSSKSKMKRKRKKRVMGSDPKRPAGGRSIINIRRSMPSRPPLNAKSSSCTTSPGPTLTLKPRKNAEDIGISSFWRI